MQNNDYQQYWALRSGDLLPEKADTMRFPPQFCRKLREKGLLFPTKEAAEQASATALSALAHGDFSKFNPNPPGCPT